MSKFTPENYPKEYIIGLSLTDQEAVERVVRYWSTLNEEVTAIVVEETDQGTVVHAKTGDTLREINWAQPNLTPNELDGYANRVYMFAGPRNLQTRRAQMLAVAVRAPEGVIGYDDVSADYLVIHLMGLGIKSLHPYGFNFWDHVTIGVLADSK